VPLTEHVALVSLTDQIALRDLMRAAAAVQKQVTRDFQPFWGVPATVDAFADLQSIPSDYRPVVIFGDASDLTGHLEFAVGEERAAALIAEFRAGELQGLHLNAYTRQPFALIELSDSWTATASHETLEMLTNPSGNALRAAAHPLTHNLRVNYLLEICDPCMPAWYLVNGLPVSDFCTPRFFDPVRADAGRYSFTGEIEHPMQILHGGYVSWLDPRDSTVYALTGGSRQPIALFGVEELARSSAPLRTLVDTDPRTPRLPVDGMRPARTSIAGLGGFEGTLEASQRTALSTAEALASLVTERDDW
jgi:hypothetical protein